MPNRALVLAALAALLAGSLEAQEPRLRARLDPGTAARVERLVDSARALALPAEPLVLKALEGESKGAPPERIVAAVRALLDGLGRARESLGPRSTHDELVAGALWLRAGGEPGELARLRERGLGRRLAVPLVVSADLVARGWPRAEAVESVARLLDAGVSDRAFLELRDGVDRAVRDGASLQAAVRREVARLGAGKPGAP